MELTFLRRNKTPGKQFPSSSSPAHSQQLRVCRRRLRDSPLPPPPTFPRRGKNLPAAQARYCSGGSYHHSTASPTVLINSRTWIADHLPGQQDLVTRVPDLGLRGNSQTHRPGISKPTSTGLTRCCGQTGVREPRVPRSGQSTWLGQQQDRVCRAGCRTDKGLPASPRARLLPKPQPRVGPPHAPACPLRHPSRARLQVIRTTLQS